MSEPRRRGEDTLKENLKENLKGKLATTKSYEELEQMRREAEAIATTSPSMYTVNGWRLQLTESRASDTVRAASHALRQTSRQKGWEGNAQNDKIIEGLVGRMHLRQ